MKPDTRKLTEAIELCFERSQDTDLPATERARFLSRGVQLRNQLGKLLSSHLDAEVDEEISAANSRLGEVVKQLQENVDDIARVEEQIAELRGISQLLETVLKGAVSLV